MDPLTIALLLGGGFLLFKNAKPAGPLVAPVPAAPPAMTSAQADVIQYSSAVPPPRGSSGSTSVSPVDYSGYIPPYVATPGASAVALGGLACSCEDQGLTLGDARADRRLVHSQLAALRAQFMPQIELAAKAGNGPLVKSLTDQMRTQLRDILAAYHSKHPADRPEVSRMSRTVAPVFLGRRRRDQPTTNV